jgi:hypothetical protein
MPKPALIWPMGEDDWLSETRWALILDLYNLIKEKGWTIGIELKGNSIKPDGWAKEVAEELNILGGMICWHPSIAVSKDIGKKEQPGPGLFRSCIYQANALRRLGLRLFSTHLATWTEKEPDENSGLERYESQVDARQMLILIESQINPLCWAMLNSGGIIAIENVDMVQFLGGGYRLPTYLEARVGAGNELVYLQKIVNGRCGLKPKITYDVEHDLCSRNVLERREDMAGIPFWKPSHPSPDQKQLATIAGYWLDKGKLPLAKNFYGDDYNIVQRSLRRLKPALLHLGAANRAVTAYNKINTHLPYNPFNLDEREILDLLLRYAFENKNCLGVVNEVTGSGFKLGEYSPWSPRPIDNELALHVSAVTIVDRIIQLF